MMVFKFQLPPVIEVLLPLLFLLHFALFSLFEFSVLGAG